MRPPPRPPCDATSNRSRRSSGRRWRESGGSTMGRLFAVEIVYRGIFQKTLAKNISRGIVLAAHAEGKPGISFGRYGDSPERNGIPAKTFAIVATDAVGLEAVQKVILAEWRDPLKATSAARAYERTTTTTVRPDQGNPEKPYQFELPKWWEMREGIAIPCIRPGQPMQDMDNHKTGGFRPERNPTFKKFTTRTMRPVVNFDTCIKCTLCWLQCPDSCFDVTPDGLYDAHLEACCGCGVCEAVCPVTDCVMMVSEVAFHDNVIQWEMWKKDKDAYQTWLNGKIEHRPERSHGFRYRGQYEEQTPEMLEIAREG